MHRFTTRDGVELAYQDSGPADGDTPPLVMLHGWGRSQILFRHQFTGLAVGRRVIPLDLRGQGASDKPRHGYRIARLASDVHELLAHLGAERVDAFGWSMGVSVWCSYIDQHGTGRLRRFVAVDQPAAVSTAPGMSEQERTESGALFAPVTLSSTLLELGGPQRESAIHAFARGAFGRPPDPAVLNLVVEAMRTLPAHAGVALLWNHGLHDWRDLLPRIDVPTLVIGCEGSHVNPASQRFVAERIPGAEVRIFPADVASSHLPFLENPPVFNAVVGKFLDRA
ncbi:alpha/beta hydrolase [Amycolatopsis sp. NPDC006131]|uniref:alpha/beta fold hydrolase n=1 Tax=Amycolatopsis sp. NPDC006131 TaxID=3156731 RepID=UPI0033B8A495